jgi:hypothetical protein
MEWFKYKNRFYRGDACYGIRDFGYRILDAGYRRQDTGCRILHHLHNITVGRLAVFPALWQDIGNHIQVKYQFKNTINSNR